MDILNQIKHAFTHYLKATFEIDEKTANTIQLNLNVDEHKQQFGDLNTNAPMVIAKQFKKNPQEIATRIISEFSHPDIQKAQIAGPGFLNIYLTQGCISSIAQELGHKGAHYFKLPEETKKKCVLC